MMSDTVLLSTRLKIPTPRRNYVVRRALFGQLSRCADMGVIFVRGGAGAGKTTLLASYIRENNLKNVGWLSLEDGNATLFSFWHYFAAAIGTFLEDEKGIRHLMEANFDAMSFDALHIEQLLTMLINGLCGDEDYYVVLDDVHCISDQALMQSLEFFIRSMPENLHLFMLSREDPPVYLGALAVSGRLLFIEGGQMQLSSEESMTFLKQTLKMDKGEEELKELTDYAEGWIGGLQLAAAASVWGKNGESLLKSGGGAAADYLTRELFSALSAEEQRFLVCTGVLAYFDADVCTRILDDFLSHDFPVMVENLTRKNLFIICLDESGGLYRYHNILSDYLRVQFSHLDGGIKHDLLVRAGLAFEGRGDRPEALRLFCEAEDYDDVLRTARTMGGSSEAWSYLDKVPLDQLIKDPDLAAQCFIYNLGSLNMDGSYRLFAKFREHYGGTDIFRAVQFAEFYIERARGRLPEYNALTAKQIEALPFSPATKAMVLGENANGLIEDGLYEEAEYCIERAIRLCGGKNLFVEFSARGVKAQLYEEMGRLNESLDCFRQVIEDPRFVSMMSMLGINFYVGIVGVYLRRMELEQAEKALQEAMRIFAEQHIQMDILEITLTHHLAELKFLRGETEAGIDYVNQIIRQCGSYSFLMLGRLIHDMACAERLSPELSRRFLDDFDKAHHYARHPFWRLLRARLIFRLGEREAAFQETEEVLVFSRSHKNRLRMVEAGILKIVMLAPEACGAEERRNIRNLLREAIYFAHEDRILMPFYLDRGILLPYLQEMNDLEKEKSGLNDREKVFLQTVIHTCSDHPASSGKEQLLSARELDVLAALALGITNREIGERLCISQATVKTHVLSIFGKLGVSSRLMAVEEGRKQGLLKE